MENKEVVNKANVENKAETPKEKTPLVNVELLSEEAKKDIRNAYRKYNRDALIGEALIKKSTAAIQTLAEMYGVEFFNGVSLMDND